MLTIYRPSFIFLFFDFVFERGGFAWILEIFVFNRGEFSWILQIQNWWSTTRVVRFACQVFWSSGLVVLKNSNQKIAGSSPWRRNFVLEWNANKKRYQVSGRGASTAWADWNCSMLRCEFLGLNRRSPPCWSTTWPFEQNRVLRRGKRRLCFWWRRNYQNTSNFVSDETN